MIRRVAFALLLGGLAEQGALAQSPPTTATPQAAVTAGANPAPAAPAAVPAQAQVQPRPALPDVAPPPPVPAALPARPAVPRAAKPVAVAERDPLSVQGRFANPGGIGVRREYYTPFTPMTRWEAPQHPVAGFDRGGGPTRADQINAFRAGQYRAQNIQNNINAYGRPIGYGFGGFGGGYR
jgi:hypothetical protein